MIWQRSLTASTGAKSRTIQCSRAVLHTVDTAVHVYCLLNPCIKMSLKFSMCLKRHQAYA